MRSASRSGGFAIGPWILGSGTAALVLACTIESRSPPKPVLLWNSTPSTSLGLYSVSSLKIVRRGDIVVAFAPSAARRLAAERLYLPYDVPLVKPVAAVAGDQVCALAGDILINGIFAAKRRARDLAGRPLPIWSGCTRLHSGESFLLSAHVPEAFDGRYFGITEAKDVVGQARLIWPR